MSLQVPEGVLTTIHCCHPVPNPAGPVGRLEILKYHSRNKKLENDTVLIKVAEVTQVRGELLVCFRRRSHCFVYQRLEGRSVRADQKVPWSLRCKCSLTACTTRHLLRVLLITQVQVCVYVRVK